ncbi:RDD family protein [Luteimonas sp. RD2P54]|uniref:RDD family protein n=1 Tax=Luteimonas endophytica TaxID=3042023 RepID=A0ABT6J5G1_9GAMM|nr:RDD family protein [Luteimonas endophytica]MDH5822055.1 RDD family protein [Luteimonas endophytica]
MTAAGFWRRYAAWSLDAALLALPVLLLGAARLREGGARIAAGYAELVDTVAAALLALVSTSGSPLVAALAASRDPRLREAAAALLDAVAATALPPLAAFAALALLYHVGAEASPHQATLGKRALGLRVGGSDGRRLAPARALARHLAGALSWLSGNLGHALAALPPERRALHDRIAGAHVLQDGTKALPAWARAWIAAQALAGAAAALWLLAAMQSQLQLALQRALGG